MFRLKRSAVTKRKPNNTQLKYPIEQRYLLKPCRNFKVMPCWFVAGSLSRWSNQLWPRWSTRLTQYTADQQSRAAMTIKDKL